MTGKSTEPGLGTEYLESMRTYVSLGGTLGHENALDLLDEVGRRCNQLIEECAAAAELDLTNREWVQDEHSEALLKRAGDNVRRLKTYPLNSPK
jgi:hypothetical protein